MKDYRSKINKSPEGEIAYSKLVAVREGQLFCHKKSGREYAYRGLKTVKINGEWFDEVKYDLEADSIPRHEFGRTPENFLNSFEILEGQYSYN